MKPAEQRLNCTVACGSTIKATILVEQPLDNMTLTYKLADVDVTLHEPQKKSVVDSAGFLRRDLCLEQYFRETEALDAVCDEVSSGST